MLHHNRARKACRYTRNLPCDSERREFISLRIQNIWKIRPNPTKRFFAFRFDLHDIDPSCPNYNRWSESKLSSAETQGDILQAAVDILQQKDCFKTAFRFLLTGNCCSDPSHLQPCSKFLHFTYSMSISFLKALSMSYSKTSMHLAFVEIISHIFK